MSLLVGGLLNLSATVTLSNGQTSTTLPSGSTAAWSSSDTSVATIQQNPTNPLRAQASGIKTGTVSFTCHVDNGAQSDNPGSSANGVIQETVSVPPSPSVTSITVTEA